MTSKRSSAKSATAARSSERSTRAPTMEDAHGQPIGKTARALAQERFAKGEGIYRRDPEGDAAVRRAADTGTDAADGDENANNVTDDAPPTDGETA